ncbi:MAG: M14 family metallopeptidase [Granulosicoccus sp.]
MSAFPDNYEMSRTRFRQLAGDLGARLHSFPLNIEGMSDLTVDVAVVGRPARGVTILSSGLHGVEAHVGAAIQLAWLEAQSQTPACGQFVLIHALNPYGFALGRRVNEDNVDLNRNFLDHEQSRCAAVEPLSVEPENSDYARFDPFLNPAHPPRPFDGFFLKAMGYLICEGKQRLQGAIVTGQYEFPRGLFYGGECSSRTVQLLREQIRDWVGGATEICHLDFHTGLGGYAGCQLLIDALPDSPEHQWYETAFGAARLVSTAPADSHVYQARGAMGSWLTHFFDDKTYRFVTAEFGTYSSLAVLGALREENQAFHFTAADSKVRARARHRLERSFCPPSPRWRRAVLTHGLKLIEQATLAVS